MHYITPEATHLRVSRLCLGCMTFGEPDRGKHARPYLKRAAVRSFNVRWKAASTF